MFHPPPVMMALDRELYSSLALYMYGKDHFERKEVGTAIGLCKLALKKLETQKGGSFQAGFAGLPPLAVKGRNHLISGIDNFKAVINDLLTKAESDNVYVYGQIVPKDAELPVLPVGINMTEPTPFEYPSSISSELIVFEYKKIHTPSIFEKLGLVENYDNFRSRVGNETIQGQPSVATDIAAYEEEEIMSSSGELKLSESLEAIDLTQRIRNNTDGDEEFARRLQAELNSQSLR